MSAIKHDDTTAQGLKLPQNTALTALSATAGEGYLAWDSTTNQLQVFNGVGWSSNGIGLFTDGGDTTYLTSVTDDLALGGTDSLAAFFMDISTGNLTITGDLTVTGDDITLATNTSGFILVADGTNFNPVDVSGDVDVSSAGVTTIQANAVALAADTTGNYVATIADAGNATVTVANSGTENAAVTLNVIDVNCTDCLGATEITDIYLFNSGDTTTGDLVFSDGTTDSPKATFSPASGTSFDIYTEDTGDDLQIAVNTSATETVDFTNAGAGVLDVTIEGDLTISGDDLVMGTNTTGYILVADNTNFNPVAMSGDIAITSTGATTIQPDAVSLANDTVGNYVATIADAGNSTITVANSGTENAAVTLNVIDVNCTDCLGLTEIADIYLANSGDTTTGDIVFNDGTTDSPKATFTPQTGTSFDIYTEDTGDDLQIAVNTASTETVDFVNAGAGVIDITVEGDLTISGDDLVMGTNTTGYILVADNTNFNPVAMSGDVAIISTGATTIQANAVALTTDTSGNYVASITNGSGIGGGDGGSEGAALTLALGALTADWSQSGAYDIVLANASSELKILESTGGLYYGILEVGDLAAADATYTFSGTSGTVWTSANDGSGSGLDADLLDGSSSAAFLQVANNLSDLNNTTTARTNLGLGTMATQNANAVAISGGTIDGTTVGASTASTGAFTTLSATPTSTNDVTITTDTDSTLIISGLSAAAGTALCIDGTNNVKTCDTGSSSATLQSAYNAGGSITVTDARDIDIVLADTTTDSNFDLDIATGSTSTVSISRLDGAGAADPTQLLLIENLDTDRAQPIGLKFNSAAGAITTAIDATDTDIATALDVDANFILFDGIRVFEGSTGTLTIEDTSGSDLATITDNGTTGTLTIAGITATGAIDFTPSGTNDVVITTDTDSKIQILALTAAAGEALCLDGTSNLVTCSTGSSSATLQSAYGAGNTITATDARDFDIVLADTTTDSNLDIDINTGSTSTVSISRLDGAGAADPTQLMLIENLDTDRAQPIALKFNSAAGAITTAIDATDTDIATALDVDANFILFDGIRAFEGATGTLTIEDTAGNDLMRIADAGTDGNLTVTGDVTVSGDDLFMGTNTTGYILVADNTNFNPVAMSGDIAIISTGATTIQADAVALATDTTGNYVATIADSGGAIFTVANSGAENAAVTLAIAADAINFTELKDAATLDATWVLGSVSAVAPNADYNFVLDGTGTGADYDSPLLAFRGNDGAADTALDISVKLDVTTTTDYKLAFFNDDQATEIGSFDESGNMQIDGVLTISGDDLFMATNTTGYILVADNTNFNPVAMSGDIAIISTGATTIQANAVALATDTTGNYVATIADSGNSTVTIANSGAENAAVTINVIDVNCTDCLGVTEIADSYVLNIGDTITGDLVFSDGATDSPKSTFSPQTGTSFDIYAEDTGDDLQISANSSSTETVDFVNVGAGVMDVTVEGALTVSGASALDGGITVDTDNFTVSGTTGAASIATSATTGDFLNVS
ncbi:MAG: hypothetical protein UX79_C0015G0001, partial [candidate division WWE3 bacterium GW2011_GWB1_47_11]